MLKTVHYARSELRGSAVFLLVEHYFRSGFLIFSEYMALDSLSIVHALVHKSSGVVLGRENSGKSN